MSQRFRQQALDLIAQATQRKRLIVYPAVLVELLDDHHAAALLMQILYWGDRTDHPDGWFYKSYADWGAELGLSAYQVRRCLDGDPRSRAPRFTLRDLGVETKLKKAGRFGAPVMHYRVDRAVFVAVLVEYLEQQPGCAVGEGDHQQCAVSIVNNVEDRSSTLSIMDDQQCAGASSDTEITNPQSSSETSLMPMPTLHPDEIDFAAFQPYEKDFGSAKEPLRAQLIAEQKRLGTLHVTDVLDRCVGRGRSWHYALQALTNEVSRTEKKPRVETVSYELPNPQAVLAAWQAEHEDEEAVREAQAALPKTERVASSVGEKTAAQVWKSAKQQLERKLEPPTFETWLQDAFLVDFELETQTLVIAVPHSYGREYCQNRLYRVIWRAVGEVAGKAGESLQVRFLTRAEWLEQARTSVAA